jgi:DNA-binding transcriptional MocR family regulator
VVAARPLLEKLVVGRFSATFGADVVTQLAMAEFLSSGAMERHVRRMRRHATERRRALLSALEAWMPEDVTWTSPSGGLGVWVTLPDAIDTGRLHDAARAAGLAYGRGEPCFFDGRGAHHLMLGFATQDPKRLRAGVKALAREIDRNRIIRRKAS